jgi:hypothetical protein
MASQDFLAECFHVALAYTEGRNINLAVHRNSITVKVDRDRLAVAAEAQRSRVLTRP